MSLLQWLRQLVCRHKAVRIVRRHRDTLFPDMRGKVLFIDRLKVVNLVECASCRKLFYPAQTEPLFDSVAVYDSRRSD